MEFAGRIHLSDETQDPPERISAIRKILIAHVDALVGTAPRLATNKEPRASIEENRKKKPMNTVKPNDDKTRSRK